MQGYMFPDMKELKYRYLYNYLNKVSVCLCSTYKFRTLENLVEIHVQQPVDIVQNNSLLHNYLFVSVTMCFTPKFRTFEKLLPYSIN